MNSSPRPLVLAVDDEADLLELVELALLKMGLDVDRAMSVGEARAKIAARDYPLCLTDMRLPDGTGLEVVRFIAEHRPRTPVAVMTAHGSTENAVTALKAGAFDYLAKPVGLEQLRALVKSALKLPEAGAGASEHGEMAGDATLIGDSPAMRQVKGLIEKLARSQAPVYVTGESGTGKERAARLIHEKGARRDRPFVAVNCGAIPETLVESEFFGYRKGAFTGADADRDGFFQAATGGTLFLDEVADLPLAMQVKLLRAIQEKKVRKVGSTKEEPVDVRVISATHQNLAECVEGGRFRQDLYYRLNVIELKMPSLRDMPEDVPAIASALLARLARASGEAPPELTARALDALKRYSFPGNVRELENTLERATALCADGKIWEEDLYLTPAEETVEAGPGTPGAKWPLQEYLDRLEREAIGEALGQTRFNKTAAAKVLGITFRALRYRLERLGME